MDLGSGPESCFSLIPTSGVGRGNPKALDSPSLLEDKSQPKRGFWGHQSLQALSQGFLSLYLDTVITSVLVLPACQPRTPSRS